MFVPMLFFVLIVMLTCGEDVIAPVSVIVFVSCMAAIEFCVIPNIDDSRRIIMAAEVFFSFMVIPFWVFYGMFTEFLVYIKYYDLL